ncbi:putative RNA-directed RNA polymerase [Helianthus debilis subsp. tardiflorus]
MGRFNNKNIAKCAARMGQCFSSTYATVDVPRHEVNMNLEDIKRNNYTFSDGIGKISPELALEVAEKLQLTDNQPCVYQIRYAGCKGVVACWPNNKEGENFKLSLRPSMNLIIRFLKSVLGHGYNPDVKDEIFWDMQMKMVAKLNLMLENTQVAFDVITASCAESGNTASIMLGSGFDPKTEPHLQGMLSSIRVAQFEDLWEKSRIFVNDGRWLMGCFDELSVLEQGQCFIQVTIEPVCRELFCKTRVKVSNICLIVPQKGDRPHTDEASGSDLDGDLYFVTWDENLIPPSKPPMEYTAAEAKELIRDVRTSVTSFYL